MLADYRNTEFCPQLGNIEEKKQTIVDMIKRDYPKARDMHRYISLNKGYYKRAFIDAYNGKCSYCGVPISIIPKDSFEIDHFVYKEDPRFKSKADAGYIENLVLSCHKCNHAKASFLVSDETHEYLHPDKPGIRKSFVRTDDFYIKIASDKKEDEQIKRFYDQLELGAEVHRLDFLLISMRGLQSKIPAESTAHKAMGEAIALLQTKRNLMVE
ncbi:MAG: HNH endonuclease [Subdoligranulum sp.]|nr:HNH endonuclease [Subdoligranulum sp.]